MPRIRNPKFKTRTRINWERSSGGRLLRLENAAHYVDSDILVYNIDDVNAAAMANHSSNQRIPPLPLMTFGKTDEEFNSPITSAITDQVFFFEKLERHNSLEPIINFLGIADMEALSKASTFLSNYLANNYLLQRLSLPLPPEMYEKLGNRKVLSLTSCCNLDWLPDIHSMKPFNQLNLTKLKELKLIGKNLNVHAPGGRWGLELSQTYHRSLQHIIKTLSNTNLLEKLEILTDSTNLSVDIAKMIGKMSNLEELVLHGIGHFSKSASYQVDVVTANLIIKNVLKNKSISTLHLVKYEISEYGDPDAEGHTLPLRVFSDTLKQLSILESKVIILDLDLPALTSLETEISTYVFDHYIDMPMKRMVETKCPILQTWNGVNLKELAEKVGSNSWAEHLSFPQNSERELD